VALVDGEVHRLDHFTVTAGQGVVVAADLLLAELLHLVGHVDHTAGEAQCDEQQRHQQTNLHGLSVVARLAAAALVVARAAGVTFVAEAVRLLGFLVEGAVTVGVTQTVASHRTFLKNKQCHGFVMQRI